MKISEQQICYNYIQISNVPRDVEHLVKHNSIKFAAERFNLQ